MCAIPLRIWFQFFCSVLKRGTSVQVTLVDFTVTQKGLEEQLLGRVIGKEQKALEEQLSDVLEEVNSNTKVKQHNSTCRMLCFGVGFYPACTSKSIWCHFVWLTFGKCHCPFLVPARLRESTTAHGVPTVLRSR